MAQETITIYRCDRCGRKISEGNITTWGPADIAGYYKDLVFCRYQHTCYRCTKVINSAISKIAPNQEKEDAQNNVVGID